MLRTNAHFLWHIRWDKKTEIAQVQHSKVSEKSHVCNDTVHTAIKSFHYHQNIWLSKNLKLKKLLHVFSLDYYIPALNWNMSKL